MAIGEHIMKQNAITDGRNTVTDAPSEPNETTKRTCRPSLKCEQRTGGS